MLGFASIRRLNVALALAVLLGALACSDSGAPPLSPDDVAWATQDLTSVTVFASSQAVIVSSSGSIYRSADAGLTWRRTHSDPDHPLYDVSIGAGGHGFAVGDARILATSDGGRSWQEQVLPIGQQDARLRALARVDAQQAVAVGQSGVRLVTSNGGALWRDRSAAIEAPAAPSVAHEVGRPLSSHVARWQIPRVSLESNLLGVVCHGPPSRRCVSLGAPGGTAYSADGGENWIVSRRGSPIEFAPLAMSERSVELRGPAKERLVELARRLRQSAALEVRIEAIASDAEIEQVGRAKDPEALFEILSLRALDTRTILEEVGVDANSISVGGAPPWDFGDLIDEDPDLLERYYDQRRADSPGVVVSVSLLEPLSEGAFRGATGPASLTPGEDRGQSFIASSPLGTHWESVDAGASFELAASQPEEEVISVFAARNEIWRSGVGGSLRTSGSDREAVVDVVDDVDDMHSAGIPITQKVLRAADFSRNGDFGLCVGDGGSMLRFVAVDSKWVSVRPEAL